MAAQKVHRCRAMAAARSPRTGAVLRTSSCAFLLQVAIACAQTDRDAPSPPGPPADSPPVDVQLNIAALRSAPPPEDGQWHMAAKDPANSRYSGLAQIDTSNVQQLRVAWTFSTGIPRGHEAAPLVVGSTMYLVSPFPNRLFALDLSQPGAPMRWMYEPPVQRAAQGVACCDVVNRGAAYANGRVFFNTLDNQAIAVDAESGRELWRVTLGDFNLGETMTMAPIVVRDRVIMGNSGGEFGVRGWIAALDAASGAVVWRAYSTGPDAEVGIGPRFRPFYPADRGPDLGVQSWPPDAWRTGGGTVWGWVSYDPELDLIYHGTANPGPWNPEIRPGDNKWTSAVFARDPATGEATWAYQWVPHDEFDHDGINENILVDLEWEGRVRRVLLHVERNGYVYVMDRETGEVLAADPFVHVTAYRGVDMQTGRLIPNPELSPRTGQVRRGICPAAPGAKDWQPAAFSYRTALLYMPHNNLCMDFEAVEVNYIAGTPYVGASVRYYAGPGGHMGEFSAWDPIARRKVWSIPERFPVWSGALVTAGDVVFYGTMDGWFKALHARTGELLWRHRVSSGIVGQPITYRGPDGRQYVAVFSGIGGWPGVIVNNHLDTSDPTAAVGWGHAMRDLPGVTRPGSSLYVFSLP